MGQEVAKGQGRLKDVTEEMGSPNLQVAEKSQPCQSVSRDLCWLAVVIPLGPRNKSEKTTPASLDFGQPIIQCSQPLEGPLLLKQVRIKPSVLIWEVMAIPGPCLLCCAYS